MTHIAQIIPGIAHIGGAEGQALLLAKGLRRRGYTVSLMALSGGAGDSGQELAAEGIRFVSLGMRKGLADPRGWIRFNSWLRRERPEVVHAHLPHAVWLARWSRLAAAMPVLVDTLHTSSTGGTGRRLGYRLSHWLPDWVTAVSKAVEETHLKAGMVRRCKVGVLPNGVDTEAWKPDARMRSEIRRELKFGDGFLWLAAGRLDAVKDYSTLLRAFAELPRHSRLIIAGRGPLEDALKKQCADCGVADRVHFLGFEPNVRRWMQGADGVVLSSLWEGLPMVLLEAGACAVPAVATRVPGSDEVIADGETGWLSPVKNAEALRCAMLRMMETGPEQRRAMGERARQFVLERFSLDSVLDRWEGLYAELLSRAREMKRAGIWESS